MCITRPVTLNSLVLSVNSCAIDKQFFVFLFDARRRRCQKFRIRQNIIVKIGFFNKYFRCLKLIFIRSTKSASRSPVSLIGVIEIADFPRLKSAITFQMFVFSPMVGRNCLIFVRFRRDRNFSVFELFLPIFKVGISATVAVVS